MLFAEKWHVTPFEILQQDIDDFILIANQMIELGQKEEKEPVVLPKQKKEVRIRVNDKTATGGWF